GHRRRGFRGCAPHRAVAARWQGKRRAARRSRRDASAVRRARGAGCGDRRALRCDLWPLLAGREQRRRLADRLRAAPWRGRRAARDMLAQGLKGSPRLGAGPEFDAWAGSAAIAALSRAETVVALTPCVTETMKQYADVLLPVGTFGESAGTFINGEGLWQT